MGKSKYTNN